jgi:hypothetical protein
LFRSLDTYITYTTRRSKPLWLKFRGGPQTSAVSAFAPMFAVRLSGKLGLTSRAWLAQKAARHA